MSVKVQLLSTMAVAFALGVFVVALGVSTGGLSGAIGVVLGVLAVLAAGFGVFATMRWLRPSTRLPEHLRHVVSSSAWRQTLVTLELRDGTRITCVVLRPGGHVVRRRTDPPFDARDTVAVVPAGGSDFIVERARQAWTGNT